MDFQPSAFTCWRADDNQSRPNEKNMEGNQQIQDKNHTDHPLKSRTCLLEKSPDKTRPHNFFFSGRYDFESIS